MASTEHGGSERTGVFECAQFGGSFTEPNQVYAYQSPDSLGAVPSWIDTREPNELYVSGGGASLALPGPFISKMEAGSLREIWRTPLSNNNVTGEWLISGAMNLPADGTVAVAQGQYLYKVNTSTGAVEKVVSLPTGINPPGDSNYDGMSAFADGTLVLKTQNRLAGCTNQGYSFFYCANQSKVAPSVVVVVDPNTYEVLDWKELPQMMGPRNTATQFQGKDYLYLVGSSNLYRYEWDGRNITLDTNWGPVPYLTKGQTSGCAPAIIGDWVAVLTNGGGPTNASLSIVAVSQENASEVSRINPIPLRPGQQSFIPSMLSTDPENNRIYAMDYLPGKVVAVDFTQSEIKIASSYLKNGYPIGVEPGNGKIGKSGLEGKSDLKVNFNGEWIYFEITQENSEFPRDSSWTLADIAYYVKEQIEKENIIPWRMKLNARVIDKNKVLASGWKFKLLSHLKSSSFKINSWKEFAGIKYKIGYRIPDEPIFLFEIPITNSKKYFVRKIKEEINQLPNNIRGIVAVGLNSTLNIKRFSNYAQEILTRDIFGCIIAIVVWYQEDYRIIYKESVNRQLLDFISMPFVR